MSFPSTALINTFILNQFNSRNIQLSLKYIFCQKANFIENIVHMIFRIVVLFSNLICYYYGIHKSFSFFNKHAW